MGQESNPSRPKYYCAICLYAQSLHKFFFVLYQKKSNSYFIFIYSKCHHQFFITRVFQMEPWETTNTKPHQHKEHQHKTPSHANSNVAQLHLQTANTLPDKSLYTSNFQYYCFTHLEYQVFSQFVELASMHALGILSINCIRCILGCFLNHISSHVQYAGHLLAHFPSPFHPTHQFIVFKLKCSLVKKSHVLQKSFQTLLTQKSSV